MKTARILSLFAAVSACMAACAAETAAPQGSRAQIWARIAPAFVPPPEYAADLGKYRSPLLFPDGTAANTAAQWQQRRGQIRAYWHSVMGPWPALLKSPQLEVLGVTNGAGIVEQRVRVQVANNQRLEGVLLSPEGKGPFPAVIVPYYETETSVGRKGELRDFGRQLALRRFVTLSIPAPGVDAWHPDTGDAACQPLSYLAYIAANCHTALGALPTVDSKRIGIVGHSYGGKWAMFASCLYDAFACAVWSDPGVVFDETRPNINYWEQWYLGREPGRTRLPGVPWEKNPRTGAYKELMDEGHDLNELHALMAPRPFLVSGGAEDPLERWRALNHAVAVNRLLGATNRVAMTSRPTHAPTAESNEALYAFFEYFLKDPH